MISMIDRLRGQSLGRMLCKGNLSDLLSWVVHGELRNAKGD